MEINITSFFNAGANPKDYSASCAELGDNAGSITWQNALSDADMPEYQFINTEEKRKAFARYVCELGFSEDAFKFSPLQLNALFIQLISGDLRETCAYDDAARTMDWEQYEIDCKAGQWSGNLFRATDGQIYYQF